MEHHNLLVQHLKRHFLVSQKTLWEIWLKPFNDWLPLKPIHSIFCKSMVWSNVSNAFCQSTSIISVWNLLSIPLRIKSASCTRQEFIEKSVRKPDWYLQSKPFLSKCSCVWVWMVLSIFLDTTGNSEMGL